jgi:hypothetical protein
MIACLLCTRGVSASPAAEKLFEDGRAALALNHLDEACDALRRSQDLEPRVGTLLNLGDCEEKRHRLASAWEAFVEARTLAVAQHDKRAALADQRVRALAPRLPYLLLAVKRVEGLVITRDGAAVPAAEWDHELPLDPRTYTLEAHAPGRVAWTSGLELGEGQHLRIEVPELAVEATPRATQIVVVDPLPIPSHEPPVHEPPSPARVAPIPPRAMPYAYHLGAGGFVGLDARTEPITGVRLVANAAPLGPGWIRAVPVFRHWRGEYREDPYRVFTTNSLGATIEYALPINESIFVAGGVGLEVELQRDSYMNDNTFYVPCLRLSPTLRLGRVDIALSYELGHGPAPSAASPSQNRATEYVHRIEAGVDVFAW